MPRGTVTSRSSEMRWLPGTWSWLVRTTRRSPCVMISTGVSVLVRSASSRRYALITLRPLTVTSFESPPVTLILPRGFSKTMRFMPAALAVADTGKSYSWPQKSSPPRMNRTPCSRACQMPLPAMQIRMTSTTSPPVKLPRTPSRCQISPSISRSRPQAISTNGQYCASRSNTGASGCRFLHRNKPPMASSNRGPENERLIPCLLVGEVDSVRHRPAVGALAPNPPLAGGGCAYVLCA